MLPNRQTLVALTQGDPSGIGPDITLSVWLNRKPLDLPPFIYIGDPAVLLARGQQLGVHIDCKEATPEAAGAMFDTALPIFPIACEGAVEVYLLRSMRKAQLQRLKLRSIWPCLGAYLP